MEKLTLFKENNWIKMKIISNRSNISKIHRYSNKTNKIIKINYRKIYKMNKAKAKISKSNKRMINLKRTFKITITISINSNKISRNNKIKTEIINRKKLNYYRKNKYLTSNMKR